MHGDRAVGYVGVGAFPDDEGGQAAREVLPEAARRSHDRLCTVSRTVEIGTPVEVVVPQGEG